MEEQKLNLSHEDFGSFTSNLFKSLHNDTNFRDITLVTNDNTCIQAHRVVLASCSSVFEEMLKASTHPTIQLSDVNSKSLIYILEFMYMGETNVPVSEFHEFLNVGTQFQVQGLLTKINSGSFKIKEEM